MRPELVKHSRFLSRVLRHDPSAAGVELDASGWIEVSVLLEALARHRPQITEEVLREIVATNDKNRFAFSGDGQRIRASQGHSIGVDLGLEPVAPPDELFHGTAERNLASIREKGLLRMRRDHVHLSSDRGSASRVGSRHGTPVVLGIDAAGMAAAGSLFYLSENGVWLTARVPPSMIVFPD